MSSTRSPFMWSAPEKNVWQISHWVLISFIITKHIFSYKLLFSILIYLNNMSDRRLDMVCIGKFLLDTRIDMGSIYSVQQVSNCWTKDVPVFIHNHPPPPPTQGWLGSKPLNFCWGPLKNEIWGLLFINTLQKKYLGCPDFVGFFKEKMWSPLYKNLPSLGGYSWGGTWPRLGYGWAAEGLKL